MERDIKKMREEKQFFYKFGLLGILYWGVLRRRSWFKLTGNGVMRVAFVLTCFNHMMSMHLAET